MVSSEFKTEAAQNDPDERNATQRCIIKVTTARNTYIKTKN